MNNFTNVPLGEDCIELSLPMNPAYVSAARLIASSIANRMKFNIEEIEDIKAAVSEACTYIIRQNTHDVSKTFQIKFNLIKNCLEITLTTSKNSSSKTETDDNLGILMIDALMDKIYVSGDNDTEFKISMTKSLDTSLIL